jgi:glycosyltransferase involved in cell wall biosynthesis
VSALAGGLARQGVEVEVLAQDPRVEVPLCSEEDGVVVTRFPTSIGSLRFAAAPALLEHVSRHADSWEVIHLHAAQGVLGLAARGVASRRLVITPHAQIQRLVRWPYAPIARGVLDRAAAVVALSQPEAGQIRELFPAVARRVHAIPAGADTRTLRSADPLPHVGEVVLAADRLERGGRLTRLVAAMASLEDRFGLVVLGARPAGRRLLRYAEELGVSERMHFAGRVSSLMFYRWLRTARVVATLSDDEPSGLTVLEALGAGASVVAWDTPANREAAAFGDHDHGVRFASPGCSPLELADAIETLAGRDPSEAAALAIPSADLTAQRTLAVYESLDASHVAPRLASGHGNGRRPAPVGIRPEPWEEQ